MMRTPGWWTKNNTLSTALLPVSWLYGGAAALRRRAGNPVRLSIPVLCVGNLTAGGAGKTPTALALGRMLKEKNMHAFYVSRGYGGALAGPLLVDPRLHTAAQVGDEPLLLAEMLPTIVSHDRLAGARYAEALGAHMLILDDGFQNPTLHKDISLIVVNGAVGFGNGRLIPAGPLRESVEEGMKRAQALVVIGSASPALEAQLGAFSLPRFSAMLAAEPSALSGRRVLGFAGIAHPEQFRATLMEQGAMVAGFVPFPDHHPYRADEFNQLMQKAKERNATLMTTAKDAVRLPPDFRARVEVLRVRLHFADADALWALLAPVLTRGHA